MKVLKVQQSWGQLDVEQADMTHVMVVIIPVPYFGRWGTVAWSLELMPVPSFSRTLLNANPRPLWDSVEPSTCLAFVAIFHHLPHHACHQVQANHAYPYV